MSISAIDGDTIRQICVSQVITTVGGALKELIENALDAGATEITIRATNWGVEELSVEDNGRGIKEDDFERVVAAHATSKISDFGDLQKGVGTFGFRGEALSALCGLSNLSVDTRHASATAGTQLTFSTAQAIAARTRSTRSKMGTTVAVRGLFCTLPVRRKELERNGKKEFQTALRTVQEYCVASVGVRIKLLHKAAAGKGYTVLVSSSGKSLIENVHEVFGMPVTKDLSKVNIKLHNGMIISGFASKPIRGCGRAKTDARFMYIRARPVDIPAFASKVNLAYRRMNQKEKPMFFLNISGNAEDFDVNVTPDKRTVMMKALDEIGEAVYEGFKTLWEGADPHAPQNGGVGDGGGSAPALPRSTSASAAMKQVAWNDEALDADADQILVAPSTPAATPGGGVGVGGGASVGGVLSPVSPSTAKGLLSMLTQSADTLCLEQEQAEAEAEAEAEAGAEVDKPEEARALDFEGPADDDSSSAAPAPLGGAAAASAAVAPAPGAAPQGHRPPPVDVDMECGDDRESRAEGRAAAVGRAAKRRRLAANASDGGSASSSSDNEYEADSMMSEESEEPSNTPAGPTTPSPPASAVAFAPVPAPAPAPTPTPTPTRGKAKAKDKAKVRTALSHASVRRPDGGAGRGGVLEGADAWGMVARRVAATPARQLASSGVEVRLLPAAAAADSGARAVRGTVRVDLAAVASRLAVTPEAEAAEANGGQGAWCAYAGKSARCEEELSSRVTKTDFEKMRVVGQFNKGFIIAGLGRELFLVDQHATDEKYNFERLKAAYQVRPQPLVQPRPLFIPAGDALLLRDHLHVFTQNGFRFKFSDDDSNEEAAGGAEDEGGAAARIYVTAVPVSYNTTFTDHDIQEIIAILRELPGAKAVRPTRTTAMLASRACRSSVMIGTALDRREMRTILAHMGTMKNPWNCPHGRPTLRHLTSLTHPAVVGSAHQMRTQAGDFAALPTPSAACARPLPCQVASDAAADGCS